MLRRTRRKIVPIMEWTLGATLFVYMGVDMIRLGNAEPMVYLPWLRIPGTIVGALGALMFFSVWCYAVFTRRGRIELTRDMRKPSVA